MKRPPGYLVPWFRITLPVLLALVAGLVKGAPGFADPAPGAVLPDSAPEGRWIGPDGEPLPFENGEEVVEYLRNARIVSIEQIGSGINRPLKFSLELDGVRANAVFRTVDEKRGRMTLNKRSYRKFHDSHIYECGAYNLSRLLGLDNVPPCTERDYRGEDGTIQLWIEDAMTEKKRRDEGKEPPDPLGWARQCQTMYLFDALIYNFDRNQGNMLITSDWKLWFIDHTRSFRLDDGIEDLERIIWAERETWERLKALDADLLKAHLRPFVSTYQIKSLLKRRDLLVEHLQGRIEAIGEKLVIYDRDEGDATQRPGDRTAQGRPPEGIDRD